ncbi:hypothetical protein NQ317_000951 [Molorchus minor]|uniref:Aldehyde dehydrogenase domain-containing protein n=1 Tax=Molorchus minor TaxID=1323400 RepID=A0ABQ9JRR5_9CUCU|nr:hypothetical protein NQ317_000951 [Molorchus minor]
MSAKNIEIKYTNLFINNEFVDAVSKKTFPVINPATEKIITNVAEADKADVDIAVAAAKAAFARKSEWRKLDASARGRLLDKLADLMERDAEELAKLEALESGKILGYCLFCVQHCVKVLRYYAGYADKIHGNTIPADGGNFALTRKEPIGVVGQIIPWNVLLIMITWKLAPALAAGCTVVVKPAEQTPLTALAVAALIKEAGFPKGVVNVLPGYGPTAGAAVALHNDIRKVAFTGSTEVGQKILAYAGQSNLKNVSLELGGKSPLVIFDDADVDEAVEMAHMATFTCQGQTCCAGSRIFVQAGIYDEFVRKATARARQIKIGDPLEYGVDQGPQIDQPSFDKILRLIGTGKAQGAKLQTGGDRFGTQGYFVQPTIFSDVTDDMTIAKEEIFGPVQSIFKFNTLEEAIERANKTEYGLAAGVITKNIYNALEFSQAVEAGSVWVNCYMAITTQLPFGGYKRSGIGREMGEDGLQGYLETKTIVMAVKK